MKQLTLQADFYYLLSDNPNVQCGIAQSRRNSRDVDRVYGIMQIYNLRVGKSINPRRQPSLSELLEEIGVAFNRRCPILGQIFVHTQSPARGKSWCITQVSTVPDFLMVYKDPVSQTKMTNRLRTMAAKGPCCPFADLNNVFRDVQKQASSISGLNWLWTHR